MIIYIVRHGQTKENVIRMLQGHLPGELTDEGKEQVRKTAQALKADGVNFKCIVSSDLKRAMDSANIIAQELQLPIVPMKMLRERDWGKYTGMPLSEARDKFHVGGKWVFPDSAETDKQIYERAGRALELLSEQYKDDTIIVVTHGQFARNLIGYHFDCSYKEVTTLMKV